MLILVNWFSNNWALGDWSPENVIGVLTTVLFRTTITQMIFFNQAKLLLGSNHFLIVIISHHHQLWLTVLQRSNCCYQSSISDISIITQTYNIHIKHPTQLEQNKNQTSKKIITLILCCKKLFSLLYHFLPSLST